MEKEEVKFDIELSGTCWDKIPEFSIGIDDQEFVKDSVSDSRVFSFTAELTEEEHVLWIDFHNKTDDQVIKTKDETGIEKDMLLNIDSIFIDDIEIETLKWNNSQFIEKNSGNVTERCINLGKNGRYQITLKTPIVSWLLKELENV
jgi:hypothetical protein